MTKISFGVDKSLDIWPSPSVRLCFNSDMAKKTILCAIDFSESSLQALKWTMIMAPLYKAKVTFLFCYRLIGDDAGESLTMKRDIETKALNQFHEIEKKYVKETSVPYQFVVEVGFFSSRIEQFIRKNPVTLLVIGNSMIENFNEYRNLSFDQFITTVNVAVIIAPKTIDDFIEVESQLQKT